MALNKKKKRLSFTLLEMMIVLCLIGLISGVVGFNMKGSLSKGKTFANDQSKERIRDIIELGIAEGNNLPNGTLNDADLKNFLIQTGLVDDLKAEKLIKKDKTTSWVVTIDNGDISIN